MTTSWQPTDWKPYSAALGDIGWPMTITLLAGGGVLTSPSTCDPFVLDIANDVGILNYTDPDGGEHAVTMTIADAANGKLSRAWAPGDLPSDGEYRGQVMLTRSGSGAFERTFPRTPNVVTWWIVPAIAAGAAQQPRVPFINDHASPLIFGELVAVTVAAAGGNPPHVNLANALDPTLAIVYAVVTDATIASGATGYGQQTGTVTGATSEWDAVTGLTGGLPHSAIYATTIGGRAGATPPITRGYQTFVGASPNPNQLVLNIQAPVGPVGGALLTGVTVDAKKGWFCPASNVEWDRVLAFASDDTGGPSGIYNFAGPGPGCLDVNGTYPLVEAAGGGPYYAYQVAKSDWARIGTRTIYSPGHDVGIVIQGGPLPSEQTHAYLMLAYIELESDAGVDTGLLSCCNSSYYVARKTGTGYASTGGTTPQIAGSRPIPVGTGIYVWLQYDPFIGKVLRVVTPYEVIEQQLLSPSSLGPEVDFGTALAAAVPASSAVYFYGCFFVGPAAQKSLQTIGAISAALGLPSTWYRAPVPTDGPGSVYVPGSPLQWDALDIEGFPHQYGFQETAGSSSALTLGDVGSIGDCPLIATVGNGMMCGVARPGWSRFAIQTTDRAAGSAQYAISTDARLPDPRTTSISMLALIELQSASHGSTGTFWSWIMGIQTGQFCFLLVDTAGHVGIYIDNVITLGTQDHRGSRRPMELVYDVTNGEAVVYTDLEVITSTHFAVASANDGIVVGSPSAVVPCAGFAMSDLVIAAAAVAELSTAQRRARLQNLGWSPAF